MSLRRSAPRGFAYAGLSAYAGERVALVVGNGAYQQVKALSNPPSDASEVASSLERLGFLVRTLTNATFDEMRRALLNFGRQARGAKIAILFFAGHGIEVNGENWLIPVDAALKADIDTQNEAIALTGVMQAISGRQTLVL
jgi:uncharacterized caspase-like protein